MSDGMRLLGDGLHRLLRGGFPIDVVLHHVHDANTGTIETDAQHLVLAIHAAFEAWNDKFGRDAWIKGRQWEKIARAIRHGIDSAVVNAIPEDVRAEVVANLTADINNSNRTSMAWRQNAMFGALGIDVADDDNRRALGLRNVLLHEGHFETRWHELTPEEAQQRRDDVERLRRLAFLIVFRLTGYRGDFLDPLRFTTESVVPVALPEELGPATPGQDA